MDILPKRGTLARDVIIPAVAAGTIIVGTGVGMVSLIASGEPVPAAPAPTAVVTSPEPAETTHLAPRCFETSSAGAQDCAWVPVAPCLSDEAGDDAVPQNYDGCYWDAPSRGNHEGASYVYWRLNRG